MAIYDINGNVLELGGSGGGSIMPLEAEAETSKVTVAGYAYPTFIENTYEPLRAAHPNYISREAIGTDASNQYTLYLYTFEPDFPEQTIWLQSGVHGREKDAYIALWLFLKHIAEDWRSHEGLAYLRWHCRICVVPVMNPWGCTNYSDYNYNGKSLNGDNWTVAQPETVANHAALDAILQTHGVNFAMDFHTTVNNSYGDYMASYKPGAPNENLVKNTAYSLARLNATKRTQEYLTQYNLQPDEIRIVHVADSQSQNTYCTWWYEAKGIPSATIEHSDYVWSTHTSYSAPITRAVEVQMNHVIAHAMAKFPAITEASES